MTTEKPWASDCANMYAWKTDGTIVLGWSQIANISIKEMLDVVQLDRDDDLEQVSADSDGNIYIINNSANDNALSSYTISFFVIIVAS